VTKFQSGEGEKKIKISQKKTSQHMTLERRCYNVVLPSWRRF